jgi:flavorubredoxin
MRTQVTEIAPGIYRLSTFIPQITPAGFTFNQFVVDGDEPLLFHCGMRSLFPLVSEATGRVIQLERLRWIAFGHVEADECGAMNQWLAAAPKAQVMHGALGCDVSVNDMADRLPRGLVDGEIVELGGGRRVRYLSTPHVPHGWDAGVLFEESTGTLLCGDLFTHVGNGAPLTGDDIVGHAAEAEDMFGSTAVTPQTAPTLRRLAELQPRTLALMHGSSFAGDGGAALRRLAADYERRLAAPAAA